MLHLHSCPLLGGALVTVAQVGTWPRWGREGLAETVGQGYLEPLRLCSLHGLGAQWVLALFFPVFG